MRALLEQKFTLSSTESENEYDLPWEKVKIEYNSENEIENSRNFEKDATSSNVITIQPCCVKLENIEQKCKFHAKSTFVMLFFYRNYIELN